MKKLPEFATEVDTYINARAEFARPILAHLRAVVHEAAPDVEETIKWTMPFFLYRGLILANMAGFKAHCAFGLWGRETADALHKEGLAASGAMGSMGRITCIEDLPAKKTLLGHIRKSVALIDTGSRTKSIERKPKEQRVAKPPVEVPAELAAALKKNKIAAKTFEGFPPSCRKEYVDWIMAAKREATKVSRVEQAVTWMAEGKRRMWKYENC